MTSKRLTPRISKTVTKCFPWGPWCKKQLSNWTHPNRKEKSPATTSSMEKVAAQTFNLRRVPNREVNLRMRYRWSRWTSRLIEKRKLLNTSLKSRVNSQAFLLLSIWTLNRWEISTTCWRSTSRFHARILCPKGLSFRVQIWDRRR